MQKILISLPVTSFTVICSNIKKITGNIYLRYAFKYISEHFDIDKESVDFLIDNNFFIPPGREYIIRSAIVMALIGQYYEAWHLNVDRMLMTIQRGEKLSYKLIDTELSSLI